MKSSNFTSLGNIKKLTCKHAVKAIQNNLNPILEELAGRIDCRTIRNIGIITTGIINARSIRISEITHKSKRKCKRLIIDAKRNYRLLKSKSWEQSDLECERLYSVKNEIKEDTPIGIDHSHIAHPTSTAIESVCKVRNEDGKLVLGHHWIQAAARIGKRRILPLNSHVFSHETKGFKSMNQITFDFLDNLYSHIGNKGMWLFDRGFDSRRLMEKLLSFNVKFVMRLQKHRCVFVKGERKLLKSIMAESNYPSRIVIRMKRKPRLIELDFREVKIEGIKKNLWLVFTKSRYGETYILLTNIRVESYEDAIRILKTYRYRWTIEDFFRSMKQELGIEKIMVRTLRRTNKLVELAMLAYFVAFKILMIGGKLVEYIVEKGGKLGLKDKEEDTIGRILKGLSSILINNPIFLFDVIHK